MPQFIYQFREKPWYVGILFASDYKDAVDKLIAEYGAEDGSFSIEEIYPNAYNENGVQRKLCVYYETIEE